MLWNFTPSFLATILVLLWMNIDAFFKITQPFVSLSHPSTAEESILINYLYSFRYLALFNAIQNKHWRVAWVGVVSIVSFHLSSLAGGVFEPRCDNDLPDVCRIYPNIKVLKTLRDFFAVYALSLTLLWSFSVSRKLPRNYYNLADGINLISQSRLLYDDAFADLSSKDELVYRLKLARGLYFYGVATGLDGEQHLTVDRIAQVENGIKRRQTEVGLKNFQYSGTGIGEKYREWRLKSLG